jgi:hypothetical protein
MTFLVDNRWRLLKANVVEHRKPSKVPRIYLHLLFPDSTLLPLTLTSPSFDENLQHDGLIQSRQTVQRCLKCAEQSGWGLLCLWFAV